MGKFIIIIVMFLLISCETIEASALIAQCSAEKSMGKKVIKIEINITLLKEEDMHVSIFDQNGGNSNIFTDTPVYLGEIELTESLGPAKNSHRHNLIITRMPTENNSLVGFYLFGSYINSIRADLWQSGKPFIYFDTYNNEALQGSCK